MSPADRRPWLFPCLAGLLVLLFLIECFSASRAKSPAWDEPLHIGAGLSYLLTDKFVVNLQHPPLLKDIIGVTTQFSGARWPDSPQAKALLDGDSRYQLVVGDQIIMASGADNVMFWARLPMILIGAMLAILLFVWGRGIVGSLAALAAVFLCVLDPNIVGHAQLATFDVGFAAFTVLFLFALRSYLRYPTTKRLVFCGLALGAVLATKFSALVLLPVTAVLVLAAVWRPPTMRNPARAWINLYGSGAAGSGKVAPNDPCPCGSGKKFKKCHGDTAQPSAAPAHTPARILTASAMALAVMGLIAVVVIEALYFFPSDPLLYRKGMELINADHARGYVAYMADQLSPRFYSYFAVAWLLKEPLASIALVLAGVVMVLRSRTIEMLDKLFLLLPPAALFLAHTFMADDIGIRYIIPALPFCCLLGGAALAHLVQGAAWKRAIAAVLCVWLVIAAIGIHPDNISYFNEAACLLDQPGKIGLDGGSKCGVAWLDDSNIDWGQGLKQLRDWASRNAPGRTIKLTYFGSFPPQYYGISFETMDEKSLLVAAPSPGLYVVSAHTVARTPPGATNGAGQWLRRMTPTAIIGHCLYVYDIK
jgi:hypothetical protein